jgi:hypothetical protein
MSEFGIALFLEGLYQQDCERDGLLVPTREMWRYTRGVIWRSIIAEHHAVFTCPENVEQTEFLARVWREEGGG